MIENINLFIITLSVTIIFSIFDSFFHKKFEEKSSKIFHIIGGLIVLTPLFILIKREFYMSITLYLGIALIIISLVIIRKSSNKLKKNFWNPKKLVRSGIYSKIRHPMHFALVLFSVGIFLISPTTLILLYSLVLILIIIILTIIEDRNLSQKFRQYKTYKKQTPMLIPNFK